MSHTDRDLWLGGAQPGAQQTVAPDAQAAGTSAEIPSPSIGEALGEDVRNSLKEKVSAASAGELWRTFIAVELPEPVRVAIAGLRHLVPRPSFEAVRWVHPDTMHVTLRFLGEVGPGTALKISQEIAGAASRSSKLSLRPGATGVFPDVYAPRALWTGFEGDTQRLGQLKGRIDGALSKLEIKPDRQKFTPHATAGRLNNEVPGFVASQTGAAWVALKLPPGLPPFIVSAVVLFRSRLDRTGARYEKLSEAPLG